VPVGLVREWSIDALAGQYLFNRHLDHHRLRPLWFAVALHGGRPARTYV